MSNPILRRSHTGECNCHSLHAHYRVCVCCRSACIGNWCGQLSTDLSDNLRAAATNNGLNKVQDDHCVLVSVYVVCFVRMHIIHRWRTLILIARRTTYTHQQPCLFIVTVYINLWHILYNQQSCVCGFVDARACGTPVEQSLSSVWIMTLYVWPLIRAGWAFGVVCHAHKCSAFCGSG